MQNIKYQILIVTNGEISFKNNQHKISNFLKDEIPEKEKFQTKINFTKDAISQNIPNPKIWNKC